jgi:hypothetical protein
MLYATTIMLIANSVMAEERAPWVGETLDGEECRGNRITFGPHDYLRRAQLPEELDIVEMHHFSPEIERLETGSSTSPINDIDYTIMAWPNHHRALHSAMKYRMMHWKWPKDSQVPPAECQLQRAIAFSAQDPVPYMMYGMLLHKAKQYDNALAAYSAAHFLRPDDVLTQYNMGLTLVELKRYEEAEKMANMAYGAGFPLPGLKNKLVEAGHWGAQPETAAPETATPEVTVTPAQETPGETPEKDQAKK